MWTIKNFKACVLNFFYLFHQKKAFKKLWKYAFYQKSSVGSWDIPIFVLFFSPSFFPCQPLLNLQENLMKINPNVSDVIICLNRNLKKKLFNIFWTIDLILKLGQLIKEKFERELWKSSNPIFLYEYYYWK